MSIATQLGDGGQTSLPSGARVSKSDARVEAYGTLDELISFIGFARALCGNTTIVDIAKSLQKDLFKIGSALGESQADGNKSEIDDSMVDRLTAEVHRIEAIDGLLADWSLAGEDAASAAFDVARTVCRRAERLAVRLRETDPAVQPNVLRYLNRLSIYCGFSGDRSKRSITKIRLCERITPRDGLAPGNGSHIKTALITFSGGT